MEIRYKFNHYMKQYLLQRNKHVSCDNSYGTL